MPHDTTLIATIVAGLVLALVQGLRVAGDGGAYERRDDPPARSVPELRPHRGEAPLAD